jgi:hypothetical protein
MNRLDASVDAARRAMSAAGELPRGLVPNKERIETDLFSGEIYFNNDRENPEWVAKVVFTTAEDRGRIEMVRAATKDKLMVELLRQVGKLEAEAQDLSAPPLSKVKMPLANYDSPDAMLDDVIQSAAAREWLRTPVGQQYSRFEKVCSNSRVFEIFKKSMEELGFWTDPTLWTIPNLNHAFILGFDRGDYAFFEKKLERRDAEAAEAERADVAGNTEFEKDARSPFLHVDAASPQSEELQVDRELPLSELRRKAYAQRFANRQSR